MIKDIRKWGSVMPSHSGQKEEEMDCNSYSYASGRGGITVIAEYGAGIELSREINMFGDVYYFVSNVWENIAKAFEVDTTGGWDTERKAYEKAASLYNTFVPEKQKVPVTKDCQEEESRERRRNGK